MVLLPGNRRGRLENLQLEVVVPLPKNKIYRNEFLIPVQRGRINSPLLQKSDGKGRKEKVSVSLADGGEGKYDHWVLRSSHVLGCIFNILLALSYSNNTVVFN